MIGSQAYNRAQPVMMHWDEMAEEMTVRRDYFYSQVHRANMRDQEKPFPISVKSGHL